MFIILDNLLVSKVFQISFVLQNYALKDSRHFYSFKVKPTVILMHVFSRAESAPSAFFLTGLSDYSRFQTPNLHFCNSFSVYLTAEYVHYIPTQKIVL